MEIFQHQVGDWVRSIKAGKSTVHLVSEVLEGTRYVRVINPLLHASHKNKKFFHENLMVTAFDPAIKVNLGGNSYLVTAKDTIVSLTTNKVVYGFECSIRTAILNNRDWVIEQRKELASRAN
jgi:hypothetical protein